MGNYKETVLTSTQHQRSNCIRIDNPYKGQAMVYYTEEQVVDIGTDLFLRPVEGLSFPFDPSETIPLINPQTDEPLGKDATGMEAYVILYSLYRKRALERDAANAVPPVDMAALLAAEAAAAQTLADAKAAEAAAAKALADAQVSVP